jgi:hypothetical protein
MLVVLLLVVFNSPRGPRHSQAAEPSLFAELRPPPWRRKIVTAAEAAALIPDGAGSPSRGPAGGVGEPTLLLKALGERFRRRSARGLTMVHSTGLGDK